MILGVGVVFFLVSEVRTEGMWMVGVDAQRVEQVVEHEVEQDVEHLVEHPAERAPNVIPFLPFSI